MVEPGYWMTETGGQLRPAVEAYLRGEPLSPDQIGLLRAYLRQWIDAPSWIAPPEHPQAIVELRARVAGLTTRAAIAAWLEDALEIGIDPL